MCLSVNLVLQHELPNYIFMQMSGFSFCLVHDYFLTARAVSIVNSSKLTHSLWLISLCLSWILLPVFEALQWPDDCLGRDYYTNLSTLSAKPSAQGPCVCVCMCVFLCFITLSLHRRKCLYVHKYAFVCLWLYVSALVCVVGENLPLPWQLSFSQWLSLCLAS